ncbi:hypothetical protein AB8B21_09905 [Tardiphaga sp. 866_E4_N2_1]|uniref:hypothetical protein n=1 Tax=unclassified Tardiphaga TaxID=2631404 RepID=UPI003F263CB5
MQHIADHTGDEGRLTAEQPLCASRDDVEYRLRIRCGSGDDIENFGRRSLPFERHRQLKPQTRRVEAA